MIADTKKYCEIQATTISEVCDRFAISDYVLAESQDVHIGNGEEPE